MVLITLGSAQRELFNRYKTGAEVALRLTGLEKVFWAAGAAHDRKASRATKHLTNGDSRREHVRCLINKELSLKRFQAEALAKKIDGGKVEVPFSIPLPDNLPVSLFYAGEMMSVLQIQYNLTAMLLGLVGDAAQTRQLVIQDQHVMHLREIDPPMQAPITVQ